MVKIAEDLIDSIKQAVPLERVMKEMYGKEVKDNKTICDFHQDSSPSLHIFPDGGYKCFVCGAGKRGEELTLPTGERIIDGGNSVFGYVMNKERVPFPEAVRIVGRFGGFNMPEFRPDPEAEEKKRTVTEANRKMRLNLLNDEDALRYLAERGIDRTDIDKWRLGMVPWDWAPRNYAGRIVFGLVEAGYGEQNPTIGMAYRVREYEDYLKHGWLRDDFERYLHAKYTEDGKIKSINPKYYNDPKSSIYDKSSFLYGLNYADAALREMPYDKRYMVVMEGYTDVILAHKAGLETSVAVCSASLTDQQADEIVRRVKRVYLWLDGDAAGQNGMARALPKLLKRGCEVLIVNSEGRDPADIVLGGESIQNYIAKNARNAVQLVIQQQAEEYDRVSTQLRTKALGELLPLLESVSDEAAQIAYRTMVAKRFDVIL